MLCCTTCVPMHTPMYSCDSQHLYLMRCSRWNSQDLMYAPISMVDSADLFFQNVNFAVNPGAWTFRDRVRMFARHLYTARCAPAKQVNFERRRLAICMHGVLHSASAAVMNAAARLRHGSDCIPQGASWNSTWDKYSMSCWL